MPRTLEPMLATPAREPPPGDDWALEIKWDGVRSLAFISQGSVRLCARRGEDTSHRYPELGGLAEALGAHEAILDGEIVAFDESGHPSFGALQRRMGLANEALIARRSRQTPVTYVAFDLLWLDRRSLLSEPYERRRELLAGLGLDGPHWRTPGYHRGDPAAFWEAICEHGLEGIVAKRLSSPYRPGRRSADWLKVQNRRRQEFVVGGYLPGEGARRKRVGSLLIGYWDSTPAEARALARPQRLVYAGGVGTGFSEARLRQLTELLAPLRRETSPFSLGWDPAVKYAARARERGGLVWVEPEVVAEVEFLRWTHEDTVRAASFKGVRDDKDPREVVREAELAPEEGVRQGAGADEFGRRRVS